MRSEPSSEATPDTGVIGCWTKNDQVSEVLQQTDLDKTVQNSIMTDNECKKSKDNLAMEMRGRSKRRRPMVSVTPDLELTDSSSVSPS